jgi:rod shape-determining protein MreC
MMAFGTTVFALNIKAIFLTILYPFEYVVNGVLDFFKSTWKSIGELEVIRKELAATRMRLRKFEETSGDLKELQRENERLRRLLGEREKVGHEHIMAAIVAKDPQNFYQTLVIDKGGSDGVLPGMPVVAFQDGELGVVGKVVETTPYASLIVTLREAKFYIGALLDESRYYGLVQGRGMSKTCALEYVDINAPIKLGDRVVTSGHSDIFPKGMNIGRVLYIDRERGQFFLQARIQPSINLADLEDVYVIKKQPAPDVEKLLEQRR